MIKVRERERISLEAVTKPILIHSSRIIAVTKRSFHWTLKRNVRAGSARQNGDISSPGIVRAVYGVTNAGIGARKPPKSLLFVPSQRQSLFSKQQNAMDANAPSAEVPHRQYFASDGLRGVHREKVAERVFMQTNTTIFQFNGIGITN